MCFKMHVSDRLPEPEPLPNPTSATVTMHKGGVSSFQQQLMHWSTVHTCKSDSWHPESLDGGCWFFFFHFPKARNWRRGMSDIDKAEWKTAWRAESQYEHFCLFWLLLASSFFCIHSVPMLLVNSLFFAAGCETDCSAGIVKISSNP